MALFIPTPEQRHRHLDSTVRKFEFQAKYLMPGLILLCLIGAVLVPEPEAKWLCVAVMALIGLLTLALHKLMLPRLRRRIQEFKEKQDI